MNLIRVFEEQRQSPWLDNLRRDALADGSLRRAIESGIRGLTSNPTIFQKAISSSALYDEQFFESLRSGSSIEDSYWDLVTSDIVSACDLFSVLYEASGRIDGYVSVEVSPLLCHDAQGTIQAARDLARRIDRQNVMIKIPATDAGLEAITQVVAEGISVNVTLIFGMDRYRQVVEAHVSGLEMLARRDPSALPRVASVASFFISRVDNTVDPRLTDTGIPLGLTAIAQAKCAFEYFEDHTRSARWKALADLGAQVQRPLWASTSTKNPAFSPTLYVDELIGPRTVNTLPDATVEAFASSGHVARTIDQDVEEARRHLDRVAQAGIDLAEVARQLEIDGLASFAASFEDLLASLADKASTR
jgi:transaldolase